LRKTATTQPELPSATVAVLALRLQIFGLVFVLACLPAQAGPKRVKVVDKKFVWGFLLPSAAATVVSSEGASCLHYGPGGQIVRHPPCGRSLTYPVYFGLGIVQAFAVYKLKKHDVEDRAGRINPPKWSRWWAWAQAWTVAAGAVGVRNIVRPSCPSGTTCRR
jgi:hypothetical protein